VLSRLLQYGFVFHFLLSTSLIASETQLFYWKRNKEVTNFGDELSRIVVERLLNRKIEVTHNPAVNPKLLALGSILHYARNGDYVWGSGINGKISKHAHSFHKLHVFAVRGPLTKAFLEERGIPCPEVFGDPAILLPELFPNMKAIKTREFVVIPNLNEIEEYRNLPNLVLPTAPPMEVLKKILEAKFVISGSLHGLIVAETFGIPAKLLRITEKENLFKFKDYYLGSGRDRFTPATSLQQALKLGGEPLPTFDKNKLQNAFPYHLFGGVK
jgi:pyruvyltransferase